MLWMLIRLTVVTISQCTQMSNHYVAHLKLIWSYMSIISQKKFLKQCPQWSTNSSREGAGWSGGGRHTLPRVKSPLDIIPETFYNQSQILPHLSSNPQSQKSIIVENKDSEFRQPGFESQHCHLLAVHLWASYLTSLIPFPHPEDGDNIIPLSHKVVVRVTWVNSCKTLNSARHVESVCQIRFFKATAPDHQR